MASPVSGASALSRLSSGSQRPSCVGRWGPHHPAPGWGSPCGGGVIAPLNLQKVPLHLRPPGSHAGPSAASYPQPFPSVSPQRPELPCTPGRMQNPHPAWLTTTVPGPLACLTVQAQLRGGGVCGVVWLAWCGVAWPDRSAVLDSSSRPPSPHPSPHADEALGAIGQATWPHLCLVLACELI